MFLLMAKPDKASGGKLKPDGVWFVWEREDLTATLIEAESVYNAGGCESVKVLDVEGVVVKAKWGPLDPGGIFNTDHEEIPGR